MILYLQFLTGRQALPLICLIFANVFDGDPEGSILAQPENIDKLSDSVYEDQDV